jgi:hypothetical protein
VILSSKALEVILKPRICSHIKIFSKRFSEFTSEEFLEKKQDFAD